MGNNDEFQIDYIEKERLLRFLLEIVISTSISVVISGKFGAPYLWYKAFKLRRLAYVLGKVLDCM